MSGAAVSPCSDAGLTTDQIVAYSRMLRPFPVKKLGTILYHVLTSANIIEQRLHQIEADPPQLADAWRQEIDYLDEQLWSLTEYAVEAQSALARIWDVADADEKRALTALVAIMRGTNREIELPPPSDAVPGPFREPEPCPACGGSGGSYYEGNCDECQGTGIDPSDPQSPL